MIASIFDLSGLLGLVVSGPWEWSLSTVIAAIGLGMVAVGHTVAVIIFFVRWSTSLQLVRHDLGSFKEEVRSDLQGINDKLEIMANKQESIVALQATIAGLEGRISRLER